MVLKQIYLSPDLVEFNTRPDDLIIIRDHTRSICNFLERQLAKRKLDDYYAELLIVGLKRCATKYQIPLDDMLVWLDDLKQNGYINKWIFKEKTFRELGIKCRLQCMLTKEAFTLRLDINSKGSSLFDEVILTTAPDEIVFYHQFKDIMVKNDEVVVTDRLGGVLFRISIRQLLHNSIDS